MRFRKFSLRRLRKMRRSVEVADALLTEDGMSLVTEGGDSLVI